MTPIWEPIFYWNVLVFGIGYARKLIDLTPLVQALAALALAAFVPLERRVRAPMVDFAFFRSRSFLGANLVGFIVSFGLIRLLTFAIHSNLGPFHDIVIGGLRCRASLFHQLRIQLFQIVVDTQPALGSVFF